MLHLFDLITQYFAHRMNRMLFQQLCSSTLDESQSINNESYNKYDKYNYKRYYNDDRIID